MDEKKKNPRKRTTRSNNQPTPPVKTNSDKPKDQDMKYVIVRTGPYEWDIVKAPA